MHLKLTGSIPGSSTKDAGQGNKSRPVFFPVNTTRGHSDGSTYHAELDRIRPPRIPSGHLDRRP
jgi:hypothetical protein